MSTRYVWGRYSIGHEIRTFTEDTLVIYDRNRGAYVRNAYIGFYREIDTAGVESSGKAEISGLIYKVHEKYTEGVSPTSVTIDVPYGTKIIAIGNSLEKDGAASAPLVDPIKAISWFSPKSGSISTIEITMPTTSGPTWYDFSSGTASELNFNSVYDACGNYISDVSGSSQSTYPSDGVQGSYWYTYQGSDNIDPSACSIPASIMGGTAITITVTPGTGKVYGGTVSYQYQVNIGSGWQTIATTSATSYQYTVPYGTASIQVRVRAQDNIGFTSSTYVTSSSVTVINNQPPTAPGSIDVTGVVAGQQATITLTAATDPDGTIASYVYERSVDGSAWQQIANVNSLTQTDTISADWGTVAYRACAVDDDGASGPYVTSSTTVVNSGWVIISGPAADMGSQPKPFTFAITPSISGTTTSEQITVDVTLDGNSIYNEAVAPGTEIELEIDTRLMRTGDHAISVSATCASFLPAANEYSFSVPVITIPDGGRMDQLEGPDGQVIFPITLARAVAGLENYSVESKVHPGAYTGSGTYGSGNPNSLALEFEPKLVIVQGTSGRMAVMIKPSGVGISIGASDSTTLNVTWDGESVRWYNAVNAANQMNTNNETYSYTAFG